MSAIEIVDKNGVRRAYCEDIKEAERECGRLERDKPGFAPFKIIAPTKSKAASQEKKAK